MWWVGTSGWQYPHWKGDLYPSDLPQRLWLERYAATFPTVEVNGTFYRLPARTTFEAWHDRLPPGYPVATKMSRYLTHVKRLRGPSEPIERFLAAAEGLGDRMGPVLLQLPPTLALDLGDLAAVLACWPNRHRLAIEVRHPSWDDPSALRLLRDHGVAWCHADRDGREVTPDRQTTDWGYARLHHGRARPVPSYGDRALRSWVDRLDRRYGDGDVFVYFNNDPLGCAVHNARRFMDLAEGAGRPVARAGELCPSR